MKQPKLPKIIITKLEELKNFRENPQYHPEDNCYLHIETVTNRCMISGVPELVCCGILHDICKKDVARINPKTGYMMSPGHEVAASKLMNTNQEVKDWINEMGANFEMVDYLVTNHMRIKQMSQMRQSKQNIMMQHPWFKYLQVFNGFDNMLSDDDTINYFIKKSLKL